MNKLIGYYLSLFLCSNVLLSFLCATRTSPSPQTARGYMTPVSYTTLDETRTSGKSDILIFWDIPFEFNIHNITVTS